jgi:Domain of unknown function (DUF4232)
MYEPKPSRSWLVLTSVVMLATAACGPANAATATPTSTTVTDGSRTALPWCTTATLHITLGQGNSGAGHYYVPIVFTNSGTRGCGLTGFPAVAYVAGDDDHQVGDVATSEPDAVEGVTLQPGQSAMAWLNQVNIDNYDPTRCGPTRADGVRVYPPDDNGSVILREPDARACAKHMPSQRQLTVRAVRPSDVDRLIDRPYW